MAKLDVLHAPATLALLNEYVILFDSTIEPGEVIPNSTTLIATAGARRGRCACCRIDFIVGSVTQDVTFVRQIWTGAVWETVSSGSQTLTAGTVYSIAWAPEAPDFRLYYKAGATAPSAVKFEGMINDQRASGA